MNSICVYIKVLIKQNIFLRYKNNIYIKKYHIEVVIIVIEVIDG